MNDCIIFAFTWIFLYMISIFIWNWNKKGGVGQPASHSDFYTVGCALSLLPQREKLSLQRNSGAADKEPWSLEMDRRAAWVILVCLANIADGKAFGAEVAHKWGTYLRNCGFLSPEGTNCWFHHSSLSLKPHPSLQRTCWRQLDFFKSRYSGRCLKTQLTQNICGLTVFPRCVFLYCPLPSLLGSFFKVKNTG